MRRKRKLAIHDNPMWNLENMTKKRKIVQKRDSELLSSQSSARSSLNDRAVEHLENAFNKDQTSRDEIGEGTRRPATSGSQKKKKEIIPFSQKGYLETHPEGKEVQASERPASAADPTSLDWLVRTNVFDLIKDELDALEDEFDEEDKEKSNLDELKRMS